MRVRVPPLTLVRRILMREHRVDAYLTATPTVSGPCPTLLSLKTPGEGK